MASTTAKYNSEMSLKSGSESWYSMLSAILDPAIAVIILGILTVLHYSAIRSQDIILMVVTFSVMYPSKAPFRKYAPHWIRGVLFAWLLVVAMLITLGLATRSIHHFSPVLILEWISFTPLALIGVHLITPKILRRIAALSRRIPTIIVGANALGAHLHKNLEKDDLDGLEVVGFFDDRQIERLPEALATLKRGGLADIRAFVQANNIERIMITLPMGQSPRILKLLDDLRDTTASVYFVPDLFMADLIQARMDRVGGLPVLAVCESPFHGINGSIKRLSDVLIALVALVLLSPVFLVAALAVAVTSPGPILYKQKRYGLDGRSIVVWKFRSMCSSESEQGPEQGLVQATKTDARVTKVGRFIRKTSIDELPQLFNVLQGRMSVVGPRPHAVAHNELYRKAIKGYMVRHKVRPGITGLAQVSGARGETKTVAEMEERINWDLRYLRQWSIQLDFIILLKTLRVFFHDPKAY